MKQSRQWISYAILFVISITFSLVYFRSSSPFSAYDGNDSVIFKSMGLSILKGGTPYVDYFDHKGPVLYFINAFGQWLIPGNTGVFLLEIIATFIVMVFLFKIAQLFCSQTWLCILAFLMGVAIYGETASGGNTCEEWELLAITPALYYCCLFLKGRTLTGKFFIGSSLFIGIILGLCFAYCFFIRPNDAVSQIGGMSTGIFLLIMYRKKYQKIGLFLGGWMAGALAISLPIIIFFAFRSALGDLYYGLIGHNLLYAGSFLSSLVMKKKVVLLLFLVASFSVLFHKKQKNEILILLTPLFLLSYLLLGNRFYEHYYTIYIPIVVLVSSLVFSERNLWKNAFYLLVFILFISKSVGGLSNMVFQARLNLTPALRAHSEQAHALFKIEGRKIIGHVPEAERDSIWNFNLGFDASFFPTAFFWQNGIVQTNRIPLFFMSYVDPQLAERDNIIVYKPLWVLLEHSNDNACNLPGKTTPEPAIERFKSGYNFIETNYQQVARTDTTICDIELWRRKDINFEAE